MKSKKTPQASLFGLGGSFYVLLLFICLCIFSSCGCRRNIEHKDSVRVEYRERSVFVPETLYFEIPRQRSEVRTKDSVSRLENDFCTSEARITSDGMLFHNLLTKPGKKSFPTKKEVVYKDSLIYRDRWKTVPVEKKLSWWDRFRLEWFSRLCVAFLIFLAWSYRNTLFRLLRMLIGRL